MLLKVKKNPELTEKLREMKLELAPIYQLPDGLPHPKFPKTILQYWLLTEDQLESIATHYDQVNPTKWTSQYPKMMNWDKEFLTKPTENATDGANQCYIPDRDPWQPPKATTKRKIASEDVKEENTFGQAMCEEPPKLTNSHRLWIKRRKFGKFIGLRGCETPTWEIQMHLEYLEHKAALDTKEEFNKMEATISERLM